LLSLWGVAGATAATDVLYAAGDNGTVVSGGPAGWQVLQLDAPTGRAIQAISGQSTTQGSGASTAPPLLFAVGNFDLALLNPSGQWTELNPILGTGDGSLNAIWPTPNLGELFVVGTTGRLFHVQGNGSVWMPEGVGVATESLFGVAGTGSGSTLDVYAVGDNGLILHRVSGTWMQEANNLVAQQLNAVWCGDGTLAGDVFAVGAGGTVLIRQAGVWAPEMSPATADLNALWGLSGDIFAAGASGTIVHRQNGKWMPEGVGLTGERLAGLWGTTHNGALVVYAAGSLGTLLSRINGTWGQISGNVTSSPLSGVWARASNEVYAVGSNGLVLLRTGSPSAGMWAPVAVGVTTNSLNAVTGYAASSSGPPDVYAVGAGGTILHQASDGSGWAVEGVILTSNELTAVWAGSDSVWAVGRGGVIGQKTGNLWNIAGPKGMTQDLFSVWGTGQGSTQITYAGGAQGLILRHQGSAWTQEATGLTTDSIVSLFGATENELWAFGNNGTVLQRVGGQWGPAPVPEFSAGASGVAGTTIPNSSVLYAVGTQGLILNYSEMNWNSEFTPTLMSSNAITAAAVNDVIAVGIGGLILHKY
jgi:hypothetical protein